MATKQFNTRVQHKIDTYEHWELAENFIPLKGELIIYTTDENGNANIQFKIGDGESYVKDLKFVVTGSAPGEDGTNAIQSDWTQTDTSALDYIKNKPTIEFQPIQNSENLISSGAVYNTLSQKTQVQIRIWEENE